MNNQDNEIAILKLQVIRLEEANACLTAEAKGAERLFMKLSDKHQAALAEVKLLRAEVARLT